MSSKFRRENPHVLIALNSLINLNEHVKKLLLRVNSWLIIKSKNYTSYAHNQANFFQIFAYQIKKKCIH
jgi:hypothetical protein